MPKKKSIPQIKKYINNYAAYDKATAFLAETEKAMRKELKQHEECEKLDRIYEKKANYMPSPGIMYGGGVQCPKGVFSKMQWIKKFHKKHGKEIFAYPGIRDMESWEAAEIIVEIADLGFGNGELAAKYWLLAVKNECPEDMRISLLSGLWAAGIKGKKKMLKELEQRDKS